MKIAYLTCVYPPYPGGIGVAAQGLAHEMARRGHEVEVFTSASFRHPDPEPNGGEGSRGFRDGRDSSDSVLRMTVHYLQPWLRFGNAAFLPQLLWRLRDFDIVHVLYPFYGAAEFVPLLKRRGRAKIIVHHTMDAVDSGWRGKVFKLHSKYIMPRIFRAADRVVVLSDDYYRNSDAGKLGLKYVEVAPNGVDIDLFKSAQQLPTTYYSLPTIIFVGGLDRAHYFKGVPVLLEACRILRERGVDFRCQIVGEGEMRKEYERQAKDAGLMSGGSASGGPEAEPPAIQFLGLVPHDKLPKYYQSAAVAVVPSTERIECFSIVAAEAQACGIPAIVSNFPGVRVTVEDGVTGYVVLPGDPEDLANRIQELVENPERARKMGEAGRARAMEFYSWKKIGEKLEGIYKGLQ